MDQNSNLPTSQPDTTVVTDVKSDNSNMGVFVITGIVMLVLVIGVGGYLYMINNKNSATATVPVQSATPLNVVPTATPTASLNQQLDSVNIGTVDTDMQQIDQEMQKL